MARHYLKPRARRYAINTRSPYTLGLQRLFLPQGDELEAPGSGGRGIYDYVTQAWSPFTVGTTSAQGLQESVAGPGLRWGASAGNNYITIAVRGETQTSMTIWWHGIYHSLTGIVLRDNTGSGGNIPVWRGTSGFDLRLGGTTDYTEAGTWTAEQPTSVLVSSSASAALLYGNGDLVISGAAAGASAPATPWYLHRNGASAGGGQITTLSLAIWNRAFSQQECEGFLADPYGALVDVRQYEQTSNVQWMFGMTAAPGSFTPAWARGANSVISAGVRAA